jgi:hypothetical protein
LAPLGDLDTDERAELRALLTDFLVDTSAVIQSSPGSEPQPLFRYSVGMETGDLDPRLTDALAPLPQGTVVPANSVRVTPGQGSGMSGWYYQREEVSSYPRL